MCWIFPNPVTIIPIHVSQQRMCAFVKLIAQLPKWMLLYYCLGSLSSLCAFIVVIVKYILYHLKKYP